MRMLGPALLLAALGAIHCSSSGGNGPTPSADTGVLADAGTADTGVAEVGYAYVEPQVADVPAALQPSTWLTHLNDDILPYWRQVDAQGTPVGNFPTYRNLVGQPLGNTDRRPRMLSRQTYAYAVGYLMTGDAELLRLARAGVDWLLEHARDTTNGGYHALLDESGQPQGSDPKTAQDTAYVMLGLAAYHFVTRAPDVEEEILRGRDLLFDSASYWDATNERIRDGMSADFSAEWDRANDGGWELVAQLDPINAFMLLSQPVLSEASDRERFLQDLRTLVGTLIEDFWQDGVFWGIHNQKGQYGSHHVDFGHTLKSHWMVLQVDKRLDDHPFFDFSAEHVAPGVAEAFDSQEGRWAKRWTSATAYEYGSDWWIYAEADQLAATFALQTGEADFIDQTAANWIEDYVDSRPEGEVIPSIRRNGNPTSAWPPWSDAKCNLWKNGYHSSEHALVMYLVSSYLTKQPAQLYFAVPADSVDTFVARPYYLNGEETDREALVGDVDIDGTALTRVRVTFDRLY